MKTQTIGEILAQEADKAGINRCELAKLTGRSRQTLYLLEKSNDMLTFETVRRVASALGLSLDDLARRLPPIPLKK